MEAHTQPIPHAGELFVPRLPVRERFSVSTEKRREQAAEAAAVHTAHGIAAETARRDRLFKRSLAVADVAALSLAALLCVALVGKDTLRPTALVCVPAILLIAKLIGLYERDQLTINKSTLDELPKLVELSTMFTLLTWLADSELVVGAIGKKQVVALWAALILLMFATRWVARAILRSRLTPERCLFIGGVDSYQRLSTKLGTLRLGTTLVGRLASECSGRRRGTLQRRIDVAMLRELIASMNVQRIVIEPADTDVTLEYVRVAKATGINVSILPRVLEVVGTNVAFDDLGGMTLLGIDRFGLSRSSRWVKRAFDLVGATLGLILVAPVIAAVALAIKLSCRGPVFFRQTRVGRDGKSFRIFKFRTMCVGADDMKADLLDDNEVMGGLFKIEQDPRITTVGRFLRRSSLDELPQLFNVLLGDMSLVGPRPLVTDEDDMITGLDRRRLHLTPGMTGPWQIMGSSRIPLREMVKIDYLYVANWSLWTDAKVLLRTLPYILQARGQ